ncbi:DoxX family protein [Gimibacter soli]|uniref:DoxX family protein n=1 Tax=Gimibacter soli TaxID=3024400 RepID=A0AAE9XLB4_9PROT|nr:DoxX family protein [Gimibacter soli]WCL53022.1 DoxX family protein [Gimibacter soli]
MNTLVMKYRQGVAWLSSLPGAAALAPLAVRLWLAPLFYASGRTKAGESFWVPSDLAVTLFEEEYRLPLLDSGLAAQLALLGETILPALLLVGLGTRFAAFGLLVMTLVIQLFVYPGYWMDHLPWMAGFLSLSLMGGGAISLDRVLEKTFFRISST